MVDSATVVGVTVSEDSGNIGNSSGSNRVRLFGCWFVVVLGCLLLVAGFVGVLGVWGSLVGVTVGVGLSFGGVLSLLVCLFDFDLRNFFAALKGDRRGLGYQLVVFVVGLGVFSVVWFALGWPAEMVFGLFSGMYTFTGLPATAVVFTKGVIRVLPVFCFLVSGLWLWVSSNRKVEGGAF